MIGGYPASSWEFVFLWSTNGVSSVGLKEVMETPQPLRVSWAAVLCWALYIHFPVGFQHCPPKVNITVPILQPKELRSGEG